MSSIRHFLALLLILCLFFTGWTIYIYVTAPVQALRSSVTYTPPFKHYTRQAGLRVPENLSLEEMPVDLILTTLVGEDPDFPYHHGVNPGRIFNGLESYFLNNTPLGGYSCITQQLAKNIFTGPKHSLYRKYVELIYALKIERYFTKAEIFTLYANIVQVGPDSYGFRQAAQDYFGKNVQQLTDVEGVFIISILPSPVVYTKWFREKRGDLIGHAEWNIEWRLQNMLILKNEMFGPDKIPVADKNFFQTYFNRGQNHIIVPDSYNNPGTVFKEQATEETKKFIERRLAH